MYYQGKQFISAKLLNQNKDIYEIRYVDNGHVITKSVKNEFFKSMNIYSVHARLIGKEQQRIAVSFNSDKSRPLYLYIRGDYMRIELFTTWHNQFATYDSYLKLRNLYYMTEGEIPYLFELLNSFGEYRIHDIYLKICRNKPYGKSERRIAALLSTHEFNKLKYDHELKKYIKILTK